MFAIMIRVIGARLRLAQGLLLAGFFVAAHADVPGNPYGQIIERNPFGLKPLPPKEAEAPPPAPPPPLAVVKVTGITSILSSKRVLLEITPAPGKALLKPILSEGERVETVEVLSINVEKNEVTIRNGSVVTNMALASATNSPSGPGPGPGSPLGGLATGGAPTQTSPGAGSTPGGFGRGGIMVAGGGGGGSSSGGASPNPAVGTTAAAGDVSSSASGAAAVAEGLRQIPSRNMRAGLGSTGVGSIGAGGTGAPLSREEQAVMIEVNRELNRSSPRRLPPLPPTPLR